MGGLQSKHANFSLEDKLYISIIGEKCYSYFQNIDRPEAEMRMLLSEIKPGGFVIRPSNNGNIALTLMVSDSRVKHFLIGKKEKEFFIKEDKCFTSFYNLIEYYRSFDHLGCKLTQPLYLPTLNSSKRLTIPFDDLNILEEIGRGNFGIVYKAIWKDSYVALKKVIKCYMNKKMFIKEAKIMHKLDHINLVKFIGISFENSSIILVMEYMQKGNLKKVLMEDMGQKINLEIMTKIALQISSGMKYIAGQNLIHRDLRAQNILINENFLCKISDFGLTMNLDDMPNENYKFPLKWTAIEILENKECSTKSDVWSFGVLFWEIVTFGESPYKGIHRTELYNHLKKGNRLVLPNEIPVSIPKEWYKKVMLKCWDENPRHRPNFRLIEEYFSNLIYKRHYYS